MEKDISSTFLYNDLSWKTFLSSVAKDISINNGIASWTINKKLQLSFNRQLVESDLDYINSLNFKEFSSCYVKKEDISILSKKYIIKGCLASEKVKEAVEKAEGKIDFKIK